MSFAQRRELDTIATRLSNGMAALDRADIDAVTRAKWYSRWLELLNEYEDKCIAWGVSPERMQESEPRGRGNAG